MSVKSVKVSAPINIAVVKYWGKADEEKMVPMNGSISMTLNKEDLLTRTTIEILKDTQENEFILNGKKSKITERIMSLIEYLRYHCKDKKLRTLNFKIISENNFPTAAGLASSASGMAALAKGIGEVLGISSEKILIEAARRGSGSACRSIYGGFVEWNVDQTVNQLFGSDHWNELVVVIAVAKSSMKEIGSSAGMDISKHTSDLLGYRANMLVSSRTQEIKGAIRSKNFGKFAEHVMRDSNQMHACCLDSYPPLLYLNNTSYLLIRAITMINKESIRIGYTFDAGPNGVCITTKDNLFLLVYLLHSLFPPRECDVDNYFWNPMRLGIESVIYNEIVMSIESRVGEDNKRLVQGIISLLGANEGGLESVITTSIGEGPEIVKEF